MTSEAKYRIRNWKDYNRSLVKRGNITVWFSEDAINKWHAAPTGKHGRPSLYSDDAIDDTLCLSPPSEGLRGFSCLISIGYGLKRLHT